MRLHLFLAALILLAACGRPRDAFDPGGDGGPFPDSGAPDAGQDPDAGSPADGGQGDDGGVPAGTAIIRVHYPAGTHTLTLRGSAAPLTWTAGAALTSGANDTWTYVLTGATAAVELKPLLDDTVWARGPNYRVAPGAAVDVYPHFTATQGSMQTLIQGFHSAVLNNSRPVYAYFPASYAENRTATYPVVYMHDGQNLWAARPDLAPFGTWNVDTAFDRAAETGVCSANGLVGWGAAPLGGNPTTCTGDGDCGAGGACRTFPEAIVIAPANTAGRIYEYTPTPDPGTPGGGGGDLYLQMLATELKPQIESMTFQGQPLRVRKGPAYTALIGSSLGGLISAYAGTARPEVWGLIGAMSPSTWWDQGVIVADVQATHGASVRPLRVYVDSGGGNADDQGDTDQLAAAYLALGYVEGVNFRHVVQGGAGHNEAAWAQRFPGAMQLLLGER